MGTLGERAGSGEQRACGSEAEDEAGTTAARLSALHEARLDGSFGTAATNLTPFAANPAWTGEQLMNANFDDWEPASSRIRSIPTSTS
jgi:hypothetical protein